MHLNRSLRRFALAFALLPLPSLAPAADVIDNVSCFFATGGHGHVYPGATVPFGMVQLSPDTRDDTWDGCAGYHYSDSTIQGFSHNHLTGTGCGDLGNVLVVPTMKSADEKPLKFSHANETASPGYYTVTLDDPKVKVELTATARVGLHRYTFPPGNAHLIIDLVHGISNKPKKAELTIVNDHSVSGYRRSDGWGGEKVYYFYGEFSRPFSTGKLTLDKKASADKSVEGDNIRGTFNFSSTGSDPVLLKVALSTVSAENAKANLTAELSGWDFDATAATARKTWETALSPMQVESADPSVMKTFYSCAYRSLTAPTILSDVNGEYRGPDGKVHRADGFNYLTEMSLWDVYRAQQPLMMLLQPALVRSEIKTMLDHFEYFGKGTLPVWPNGGRETWCMIGNHAIPIIAEAYLKGIRDFDASTALDDMVSSTTKNKNNFPAQYYKLGYVAAKGNDDRASVSKTIEMSYDDACIARLARALGKQDIADRFGNTSHNWQHLYDASAGFMIPKEADGKWLTGVDPDRVSPQWYTEANAWQYLFAVQQDVPGLIATLGGDDAFVAKLDAMFTSTHPMPSPIPDVTGLIGMYAHGNEPCHHVAYLYDYAGHPEKSQRWIRETQTKLYNESPEGDCGNDDCGQMSAWYVFSAFGIYPVDPSSGIYMIGSPLVEKGTMTLPGTDGRTFSVEAHNASRKNCYIQSATLNGKPLERPWITHEELTGGAKLTFEMSDQPSETWGRAARTTAPYPATQPQ